MINKRASYLPLMNRDLTQNQSEDWISVTPLPPAPSSGLQAQNPKAGLRLSVRLQSGTETSFTVFFPLATNTLASLAQLPGTVQRVQCPGAVQASSGFGWHFMARADIVNVYFSLQKQCFLDPRQTAGLSVRAPGFVLGSPRSA